MPKYLSVTPQNKIFFFFSRNAIENLIFLTSHTGEGTARSFPYLINKSIDHVVLGQREKIFYSLVDKTIRQFWLTFIYYISIHSKSSIFILGARNAFRGND